ncbi:unnamed protein product [Candidula unifasciata]|uniref:Uncharacterized protein n=1 Tax=Candidula unifasciata TaxID=100452 RepID=A0A8S4A1C8_9EUPU|nr:unnamed protein product [Candidula unifasciata]
MISLKTSLYVTSRDREMDEHLDVNDTANSELNKNIKKSYNKMHISSSGNSAEAMSNQEVRGNNMRVICHPSPKTQPEGALPEHRPASRHESMNKKVSFPERPGTSMSKSGSARPRSSRHGAGHKLKANQASSGEEDDEVLSDLLGTVRQYAQEIREMYAPMKKDEEERTQRRKHRNSRRKSKELNKDHAEQTDKRRSSHFHLEVRAEIHKLEDSTSDNTFERGKLKQGMSTNSRSHQTSPTNHAASLQVEEVNLSSSWPRSNQMSTSLERYWSDVNGTKHKPVTSSSPKAYNRSKTPSDWNEAITVQHEKEMLNRAFQRINKPYGDPLIRNFPNSMPVSQIQEQFLDSRQSVIEVARQHKQAKQCVLPSISILAPPSDFRKTSRRSSGGMLPLLTAENMSSDTTIIPSAPSLEGDQTM